MDDNEKQSRESAAQILEIQKDIEHLEYVLKELEKDKKTELGIIITATHDFKKVGGFDGAVGTYEKHIRYFSAYHNYIH